VFGRDSLDGQLHDPLFGHYRFAQIAVVPLPCKWRVESTFDPLAIGFSIFILTHSVKSSLFDARVGKEDSCHFQASNAFANIASPFVDFSNISFAMRLSLSSNGKSNQARVRNRSRLRAVS
jgi:hypothetical protein